MTYCFTQLFDGFHQALLGRRIMFIIFFHDLFQTY